MRGWSVQEDWMQIYASISVTLLFAHDTTIFCSNEIVCASSILKETQFLRRNKIVLFPTFIFQGFLRFFFGFFFRHVSLRTKRPLRRLPLDHCQRLILEAISYRNTYSERRVKTCMRNALLKFNWRSGLRSHGDAWAQRMAHKKMSSLIEKCRANLKKQRATNPPG